MKCSLAELHNLLPGYLAQTILRAIVLHRDRCSSKRRQFDNFQSKLFRGNYYKSSMAQVLTGLVPVTSSFLHRCFLKPFYTGNCFLSLPNTTPLFRHVSLRIEARGIPRKESNKTRNRRIRRKFNGSSKRPRLSVFCSAKQLYAMLVDDHNKKTLFYASTLQNSIREDPQCSTIEAAQKVGQAIVQACMELDISEISSYDRNGFARGERMQAFEVAIAEHGFLPR